MSVQVRWYDDEKTILFVQYDDPWTWDEYDNAVDQYTSMMKSVAYNVTAIHYNPLSGILRQPPGAALWHLNRAAEQRPKNLAKSYVVVKFPALQIFFLAILRIIPANRERQPMSLSTLLKKRSPKLAKPLLVNASQMVMNI